MGDVQSPPFFFYNLVKVTKIPNGKPLMHCLKCNKRNRHIVEEYKDDFYLVCKICGQISCRYDSKDKFNKVERFE